MEVAKTATLTGSGFCYALALKTYFILTRTVEVFTVLPYLSVTTQ